MRPSFGSSGLALVAWLGLIVHLGASACGSLLCGWSQGPSCCAMATGAHAGGEEAEAPGRTMQRAPCGCCEQEVHGCATSAAPVIAAEEARLPVAPPWAPAPAPVVQHRIASRANELPSWWARPPPPRPGPTETVVLLL